MSKTNETRHVKVHETCKCKSRLVVGVVIINNVGMMINVDVNVKNWLAKVVVIKDLFGLVNMNVNVINHMILENI